jgi:mono/diheme cytochrome c family protein
LDNQISAPQVTQRLIVTVLALTLCIVMTIVSIDIWRMSDPYVKRVLSVKGNATQGQAIFQMNCSGCHGLQAEGIVGPTLIGISKRKTRERIIHQVISGETPPMPQFQPSAEEMANLLKYLERL